jgi:hypothetical protein
MPFKATYGVEHGRGRASQSGGGLRTPQCDEILRDFYRFKEKSARAAFADEWVRLMARQLDRSWVVLYELLALIRSDRIYENASYMADGKTCSSFEEYWKQVVGKPFETWAELERTYHFIAENAPELLKTTFDQAKQFTRGQIAAQQTTREDVPEKQGERTDIGKFPKLSQLKRGEANGITGRTQKKIDRLARDFPEYHAKVRAGELSVHGACVAAGIAQRTISIPDNPQDASRAIVRHFQGEALLTLIREQANWAGGQFIESADDPARAAEGLISRFGNEYGCALTRELVRLLGPAANLNPIGNDLSGPAQP